MRKAKSLSMLLILSLVFTAMAQQGQTGVIRGVVVTRDGSRPLGGATVELQIPTEASASRRTITDDDGAFVFSKVPAGSYRLSARRAGHVTTQYGQQAVNSPERMLTLANGQTAEVRLAMTATGSISGRVTTKEAKPMANARVLAMRASYQEGRRVLTGVQETLTDDIGAYRLFFLPPGQYYINATVPDGPSGAPLLMNPLGNDVRGLYEGRAQLFPVGTIALGSGAADDEAHIPIYFPGTGNGSLAQPIEVGPSADIRGIDIAALPLRTRLVRGNLSNGSPGTPPKAASQVRLLPAVPNSGPQYQTAADPETGAFEFAKVVPGSYVVYSTMGGANGPKARALLEVRDQNIENLSLVATPGLTLSLQVRVDGAAGPSAEAARLRVSLRPEPAVAGLPAPAATPSAEGAASISGILAGSYRLYVSSLSTPQGTAPPAIPPELQNFYVKSARFGDQDVLIHGLRLETQPEGSLEIVMGSDPGRLAGRASSGAEGVRIVLIPDEGRGFRTDAYKSVFTNSSGQFAFERIPPGAYRLYAWNDVAEDVWFDPDFLRNQEGRGIPILIREGNNPEVSVTPQ